MYEYYNAMSNTTIQNNNNIITQTTTFQVAQSNAYKDVYKMIGNLIAKVSNKLTR